MKAQKVILKSDSPPEDGHISIMKHVIEITIAKMSFK